MKSKQHPVVRILFVATLWVVPAAQALAAGLLGGG
jgi:hypothetical protein